MSHQSKTLGVVAYADSQQHAERRKDEGNRGQDLAGIPPSPTEGRQDDEKVVQRPVFTVAWGYQILYDRARHQKLESGRGCPLAEPEGLCHWA